MTELYAPFTRTGAPIMVMDSRQRGAVQVRGERPARHPHLVHERDRQRVRAVRRRRRPGAPGRRVGSAHRAVVPVPGRRVRRQLLSEGRQGASSSSRGTRATSSRSCRPSSRSTTGRSRVLAARMEQHFGSLTGRTIAVWGLAFKPRTDDMREAPAIAIIERLLAPGPRCRRYDPAGDAGREAALRHRASRLRREELRRARGGRRAGGRHGVERVPGAGLREDAQADESAGRLRRPEHLLAAN